MFRNHIYSLSLATKKFRFNIIYSVQFLIIASSVLISDIFKFVSLSTKLLNRHQICQSYQLIDFVAKIDLYTDSLYPLFTNVCKITFTGTIRCVRKRHFHNFFFFNNNLFTLKTHNITVKHFVITTYWW